ncbi:hypothetical protein TcWFU_009158 [Taenia crassiceps]|uniref:Uncharacterized protein n=1 Tax=Taenia crassiceps TaxID=6207 RepID=A0ABR4Q6T6_9CEST
MSCFLTAKKLREVLRLLQCKVVDSRVAFVEHFINPDRINYPDFHLYDLLIRLMEFNPKCLEKCRNLQVISLCIVHWRLFGMSSSRSCTVMVPTHGYWDIKGEPTNLFQLQPSLILVALPQPSRLQVYPAWRCSGAHW